LGEDVDGHAGISELLVAGGAMGERSREIEMFDSQGATTAIGSRGGRGI